MFYSTFFYIHLSHPLKDQNPSNKHQLEVILESITDAFYALDENWCFTYFNAEAERVLRRKRSEVLGRNVWDEFPHVKGTALETIYRRTASIREPHEFEYFYTPLDAWYNIKAFPAEKGITVYFRDITERKTIEADRRQLIADLNERVKEQRSLYNITRILRDEISPIDKVLRAVLMQLVPAVQYPEIAEARIQYSGYDLKTGQYSDSTHKLESRFLTGRGLPGSVSVIYKSPPPNNSEQAFIIEEREWIDSIADLIRSYLDKKHAQDALRESEARFRSLFQSIPSVAVQGYLMDGTVQYWNDASESFYGYTKEEALGKNLLDLIIPPDMRDNVRKHLSLAEASGETIPPGELGLMRKDGSRIQVYSSHALIKTEGKPTEFFCIDIDLTEQKKLEQQFLRAQRMEGIGTLAGGIAHDLNNLLAPIIMGVDLLRRDDCNEKARMIIDNIERSARRGSDLIKQVLSFARGVEGARIPIQVRYLLREMESIIANTFPKNILLSIHAPDDLKPVVGDPTQLNQVLLNLCVNARDAMPEGGRLSITAHNVTIDDDQYALIERSAPKGDYVLIEVSDEGHGIPTGIIDKIFDPFFTTKELSKGTGLGLSTVLGILRSHGGFVNAYSEDHKGSVFKIYLPTSSEELIDTSKVELRNELPRGKGETILVVDDEASILTITRQTLEAFGYLVLTAENGAEAIAVYAQHRTSISLVLTDMMMPVMDGPALISAIRSIDTTVPIIAASGLNANGNVAKAAKAGVSSFLDKPYSADTLLRTLAEVLQGRETRD